MELYNLLRMEFTGVAAWETLATGVDSDFGIARATRTDLVDRPLVTVVLTARRTDNAENAGWRVLFLAGIEVWC